VAGVDAAGYADVHVEPTDVSFKEAARVAREIAADGYASLGGGSTMDTCKTANLYATYPAGFLDYVNAPHGMAYAVAGLVREFKSGGYPDEEPMVPHGMSVIVNAPLVFRYTAESNTQRHIEAAQWLVEAAQWLGARWATVRPRAMPA